MKEIIYLDIKLVNSLLAQLDQGLILKQISEENSSKGNVDEVTEQRTTTKTGGVGFAPFVNGGLSEASTDMDKHSVVYSSENKELLETAIDDFSLDLLLDKLSSSLKDEHQAQEGDFTTNTDHFIIYDFSYLKNAVNVDALKFFIPEEITQFEKMQTELSKLNKKDKTKHASKIKEIKSEIENSLPVIFRKIADFSSYMNNLFKDCVLFKIGKNICICENKNIRIPQSTLSLLNGTKRKATMLGIVTSNIDNLDLIDFSNGQPNKVLSHGANAFITITTNSFDIVQVGDTYIRPIALYFE